MKKIFLKCFVLVGALTVLSGCNKTLIDINLRFDKIHMYQLNKCYDIKEWKDYDGEQIQVKLYDGTVILTSTQHCMLISGKCPICNDDE